MKHYPDNRKHLGGHAFVTHLDLGVLSFCKTELGCKSFLDVGCGPGGMVELARRTGYDPVRGIDGDPRVANQDIIIHDFATNPYKMYDKFDLGYSCEFVEHVEEKYIPNYMPCFQKCKFVVMTFAPKGTRGYHHVNCRNAQYWIEVFSEYGFVYEEALTNKVREVSLMERNFVRENGLVFINEQV